MQQSIVDPPANLREVNIQYQQHHRITSLLDQIPLEGGCTRKVKHNVQTTGGVDGGIENFLLSLEFIIGVEFSTVEILSLIRTDRPETARTRFLQHHLADLPHVALYVNPFQVVEALHSASAVSGVRHVQGFNFLSFP